MRVLSPTHELLRQGMGIGKAPTVQQEVAPLAAPAVNAVQEGHEGWIMGGFILHHHR